MKRQSYGQALRRAIEKSGTTVHDLASKTGVARTTISAWLNGYNRLRKEKPDHAEAVRLIAEARGFEPSEVWDNPDLEPTEPIASMRGPAHARSPVGVH